MKMTNNVELKNDDSHIDWRTRKNGRAFSNQGSLENLSRLEKSGNCTQNTVKKEGFFTQNTTKVFIFKFSLIFTWSVFLNRILF